MAYIIPQFGIKEPGENCLYSSTRNVLLYQGLHLTEAEVFFAFDGLNSVFYPALQKYGFLDIVEHLQNHLLPEHLKVNRGNPDVVCEADLLSVLQRNLPVSIVMHAKDATYSKTLVLSGAPGRHVAVLYGLDVENNTAYVWDNFILNKIRKVSHFSGPSSLSMLKPGILEYFWIEVFSSEPIDFSRLLCQSLTAFLNGNDFGETITGERGLLAYLNSISASIGNAQSLRDKSYEIYFTLRVSTYETFLNALTTVLEKVSACGIAGFDKFHIEGRNLQENWNSFATTFLRCGMKNNVDGINSLLSELRSIIAFQEDYFSRLIVALEGTSILINPPDGLYYQEKVVKNLCRA